MPTKKQIREEVLRKLEDVHGNLAAEQLVRDARKKSHPCHADFEWNDGRAADKYRLQQARTIIRSVSYTRAVSEHVVIEAVCYVRDQSRPSNVQGYVATRRLLTESEAADASLDAELVQIEARIARGRRLARIWRRESEFENALERMILSSVRAQTAREAPSEHDGDTTRH